MISVIIVVAIVLLDQLSKIAVRSFMTEGQSISIIDGFFSITYYNNTGVAFSFLAGHRIIVTIVQVIALVVVALFIYFMKGKGGLFEISLAMILGGGIGNLIDRLVFGKVTDMISFSIFPPVFNIADIGVTVGCMLLLLDLYLDIRREKEIV